MVNAFIQRSSVLAAVFCLGLLTLPQHATAAIIKTETAIEATNRDQQIDRVNEVLSQQAVQEALVSLGVDPDDARARVRTLTAEELQTLDQRLNQLPAGGTGVIEVVGIVAIVLIILELLHVTNFFTEF